MEFSDFEETTIHRRDVFKGKIIDLVVDDVQLPSGETSQRELVFHQGAVGILAITAEEKIVLVRQFRKPLERVLLEIPAGKIEPAEDDYCLTAARELEEETGFQAETLDLIMTFATSPGFANEILYLYEASDLVKVENPLPPDEDELIELVFLSLEEAQTAIKSGEIYDAKTILAIQHWQLNR